MSCHEKPMNKEQAAEALGISVRTLQRMAQRGEIAIAYVRGKKGDEATFDDSEVERVRGALQTRTYVSRASHDSGNGAAVMPEAQGGALMRANKPGGALAELIAAIDHARGRAQPVATISDLAHKLRLTIPEAAQYTGLAKSEIERAIASGKLKAAKRGAHGARVIRRADLEAFERKG
jgi:excisionase family DNA binding protein